MKTQVKNVLEKLEGVQTVNVNLASSTIDVGYNKKADEESIRSCIEHVGGKVEN
jgi:copper chaperone CopZ